MLKAIPSAQLTFPVKRCCFGACLQYSVKVPWARAPGEDPALLPSALPLTGTLFGKDLSGDKLVSVMTEKDKFAQLPSIMNRLLCAPASEPECGAPGEGWEQEGPSRAQEVALS